MSTEAELFLRQQAQLQVDNGFNMPNTPEDRRRFFLAGTYLGRLREHYNIRKIYYPGCTYISILESAFRPEEIAYLDKGVKRTGKNAVLGDYLHSPFRDASFDAIFINDIHVHQKKGDYPPQAVFQTILKAGKRDAVILVGKRRACPEWEKELKFITSQPGIIPVVFPIQHPDFALFQKIER